NYPFKTFLILDSAAGAPGVCSEKECRLDEWTLDYLTHYRTQLEIDPRGPAAIADLISTAMDIDVESVAVEVGHTAVRRCLGQLSYHCKTARLEQASARWALGKLKKLEYSYARADVLRRFHPDGSNWDVAKRLLRAHGKAVAKLEAASEDVLAAFIDGDALKPDGFSSVFA
ncbi:unnamed protein product, partial [Prorocentrum cordatum]